jgi:hypothetical protein
MDLSTSPLEDEEGLSPLKPRVERWLGTLHFIRFFSLVLAP